VPIGVEAAGAGGVSGDGKFVLSSDWVEGLWDSTSATSLARSTSPRFLQEFIDKKSEAKSNIQFVLA
jgi:hypothetical protein